MKKALFAVVCVALVLGFTPSLHAAECGAQQSVAPDQAVDPLLADPAALLDGIADTAGESLDMAPGAAVCAYILCIQNPDGSCGCEGFVCKGHFICGEPIN